MPPNTVYVGRGTPYGNPYVVGQTTMYYGRPCLITNLLAKTLFRRYLIQRLEMGNIDLEPLRGKNIACWCHEDEPHCHGDVLLELANA